jgi:hypothetical protein
MNPCVYSAHVFLVNAVLCARVFEFRYAYAFLALYGTSVLYHTNVSWSNWIDKCAIGLVVLLGLCKFFIHSYGILRGSVIIGTCLVCFVSHFSGFSKTDVVHAMLIHGSTFVGHGLICL